MKEGKKNERKNYTNDPLLSLRNMIRTQLSDTEKNFIIKSIDINLKY